MTLLTRRQKIVFAILLGLSVVLEFVLPTGHGEHDYWWMHVPAFFALYGLGSCILIILFAKWLGKAWLQKDEDYYKRDRDD